MRSELGEAAWVDAVPDACRFLEDATAGRRAVYVSDLAVAVSRPGAATCLKEAEPIVLSVCQCVGVSVLLPCVPARATVSWPRAREDPRRPRFEGRRPHVPRSKGDSGMSCVSVCGAGCVRVLLPPRHTCPAVTTGTGIGGGALLRAGSVLERVLGGVAAHQPELPQPPPLQLELSQPLELPQPLEPHPELPTHAELLAPPP